MVSSWKSLVVVTTLLVNLASAVWMSAQTVEKLQGDLSSVSPAIQNCGGFDCSFYLMSTSCLGSMGPLGAFGPLGILGPVGSNTWNPSMLISGLMDWSSYATNMTSIGGPMSYKGPLGSTGPLGSSYNTTLPEINDFAHHLQAMGLWSILGPVGPLGPLGALGPLGPVGGHGYERTDGGDYVDQQGNIHRDIEIIWSTNAERTWQLYEYYNVSRAMDLGWEQDTSFLAEIVESPGGPVDDNFKFVSSVNQYVSIVVSPVNSLDTTYYVDLYDKYGTLVASSQSDSYINWIIIQSEASTQYTIHVHNEETPLYGYRLFVVGSTDYIAPKAFAGAYLREDGQSV